MTGDNQERCETCGHALGGPSEDQGMAPPPNPYRDEPRTRLELNLRQHVEVMDRIADQLDELLSLVRAGDATGQQALEGLEGLRQDLKPRHGLCIDPQCAMCRVHEEAIKEHVLLYVDWKVPGTITQLEQTRHRN
jgi:hypothetical protein